MEEIETALKAALADSSVSISRLWFCGTASPEGSYELNRELSRRRLEALERVVRSHVDVPEELISRDPSYIPWERLAEMVSGSSISHKDEILAILGTDYGMASYPGGRSIDGRIPELKKIDGGRVWTEMNSRFFSQLRNAVVLIVYFNIEPADTEVVPEETFTQLAGDDITVEKLEPVQEPEPQEEPAEPSPKWQRRLYVKTNLPAWGLLMGNAAFEADLCPHLSISVPVYYSAWNYFREDLKFRTLSVQPELRLWFSRLNDGMYIGGHFGLSYYNFAFADDYRIQDHRGTTPALGGGLSLGYRLPVNRNGRWKMEFSVGAGAYDLYYDKYRNRHNGLRTGSEKKTYIGVDQAAITLAYTIGLKKKGGAR